MKIPSIDYSPLFTATQAKFGVQQAQISADASQTIPQSIKLQEKSLQLQRQNLVVNTVLGVAELGLDIAGFAVEMKQQSDLENAKTNLLTADDEYRKMSMEAILNNTTTISVENGMAEIQLSPELEQYKADAFQAIDNSNKSKSVKRYEREQLQQVFASAEQAVYKQASERYLNDLNTSFSMNHDISLTKDIQSAEGYAYGEALINSRSDLTKAQKEATLYAYKKEVDYGRADATATTIAKTEGVGKALAYASSLQGFEQSQVQTIVSNATKASAVVTQAVVSEAQNVMTAGLEAGKSPSELYAQVENTVAGQPTERRKAALDAISAAHTNWAVDVSMQNWMSDKEQSLEQLQEVRDSINNGERSYMYEGIPKTKESVLSMYDDLISGQKKQGATLNSQAVKDNMNAAYNMFVKGEQSGEDVIRYINSIGSDDPDLTASFIKKVQDNVIPEQYKPMVNDFAKAITDSMKANWKIGKDSELSAEQRVDLIGAETWVKGAMLDLFMESASGNMSTSDFTNAMNSISRIYTSKEMDVLNAGSLKVTTRKTGIESAIEAQQMFATVDPVYSDSNGRLNWASPQMEQTFDQMAIAMSDELSKRGIDVIGYNPMPTRNEQGQIVDVTANPVFQDRSGSWYMFNGKQIMQSEGGDMWRIIGTVGSQPGSTPTATQPKPDTTTGQVASQMVGTGGFGPNVQQVAAMQQPAKQEQPREFSQPEATPQIVEQYRNDLVKTVRDQENLTKKESEVVADIAVSQAPQWATDIRDKYRNSSQAYLEKITEQKRDLLLELAEKYRQGQTDLGQFDPKIPDFFKTIEKYKRDKTPRGIDD